MTHPLRALPDRCAVIGRRPGTGGQWGHNCPAEPTHSGWWRFHDTTKRIQLCSVHAAELADEKRLHARQEITR